MGRLLPFVLPIALLLAGCSNGGGGNSGPPGDYPTAYAVDTYGALTPLELIGDDDELYAEIMFVLSMDVNPGYGSTSRIGIEFEELGDLPAADRLYASVYGTGERYLVALAGWFQDSADGDAWATALARCEFEGYDGHVLRDGDVLMVLISDLSSSDAHLLDEAAQRLQDGSGGTMIC